MVSTQTTTDDQSEHRPDASSTDFRETVRDLLDAMTDHRRSIDDIPVTIDEPTEHAGLFDVSVAVTLGQPIELMNTKQLLHQHGFEPEFFGLTPGDGEVTIEVADTVETGEMVALRVTIPVETSGEQEADA